MTLVYANVFESGQPAVLCHLQVQGNRLIAKPKTESNESASFDFELSADTLRFGGDDGSQVIVTNNVGQTLYAEREALEPLLANLTDPLLRQKISGERQRVKKASQKAMLAFVSSFLGCGLLVVLAIQILNWGVDRAVDRIPIAWEVSLGEAVASAGLGEEVTDPTIVEPVKQVLDKLNAAHKNNPYTLVLHVVDNPEINAFAAPGGQVIVNTGLLKEAKRPEELAGVLAHEIQHVTHRHGLRNMVHSLKWQLVASLVVGDVGSVQQVVLGNAPHFLSLSYSRSLEEEADLEGTKLLIAAQIDSTGTIDFFKTIKEQQLVSVPAVLSSHPETQHRIERLQTWLAKNPAPQSKALEVGWSKMKEALDAKSSPSTQEDGSLK